MVNFVKVIVTFFMVIAAIILFLVWITCGTLLLIALIIRLICLYTIALLNSFVSGNPLNQDYSKAIQDVVNMYVETFYKIFTMPKLPWQTFEESSKINFRSLLPNELKELKKSWYITLIVFASYILSFGISLSYLLYSCHVDGSYYEGLLRKKETSIKNKSYKLTEISNLNLRVGKDDFIGRGGYDKNSKVYFEVFKPISLRSIVVKPNRIGKITINLYDINDKIIEGKTFTLLKGRVSNKIELDFKIREKGIYYMKFEGSSSLWYNSSGFEYSLYWNNVMRISGVGNNSKELNKNNYYKYFYDWNYSLLLN